MAKITHPANIMRGSQAVRPIQRTLDFEDRMAAVAIQERARMARAHEMPAVTEPARANVPGISGVKVRSGLVGGTANINSSSKAR